jgi:hypothetical protein
VSFDFKGTASNTQCFKRFDFEANEAVMQPAGKQIKVLTLATTSPRVSAAMQQHEFAVGTQVVAVASAASEAQHLEDLRVQVFPPKLSTLNPNYKLSTGISHGRATQVRFP